MAKRKDLTNQVFNNLKVLYLDEEKSKEKKQSYWICECLLCGKKKSIFGSSLTLGRTQSCGCLQKEKSRIDITNQRFGKLVARYQIDSKRDKNGITKTQWHCECDCGNECDVLTENLRKGYTKSCGCLLKEYRNRAEDLTNKRFGKLFVVEKDEQASDEKGRTYWKCLCDCGNYKTIYHTRLVSGEAFSCGCSHSKGENFIESLLKEKNISYSKEYWFQDLYGEGGAHLRFDFAIITNNSVVGLIEYNGIQHYEPIEYWGGKNQFEKQQRQDNIKIEYCKNNNIPLLVLNYNQKEEEVKEILSLWLNTKI